MISMIFLIDSSLKKKHCLKGKMDSRVEFFCFCECFNSINNSFSFPTLSLEGFIWYFFNILWVCFGRIGQLFEICFIWLWIHVFWNGFYARKVIFIQLQEFPIPPYCRCSSVTKRSDSGIAVVLKALKCIFETPHNNIKLILSIIESYSIKKMGQNFLICLRSGPRWLTPPPFFWPPQFFLIRILWISRDPPLFTGIFKKIPVFL